MSMSPKLFAAVLCGVTVWANESVAQNFFELRGTTTQMVGGSYKPLPKVHFSVLRQGPVFPKPLMSDAKGEFQISVPAGTPVSVLFLGSSGYLPQLQSLSGEAMKTHDIHVTLITIAQAQEEKINVYQYLNSILEHLSARGIPRDDPLWRHIDQMRRPLG